MKYIYILLLLLSTITVSNAEDDKNKFDISTNIGVTSNYIWRGISQTNNESANQGGLDISYYGVYVGSWMSGLDDNKTARSEVDLYIGYSNDISFLTYDMGYMKYLYSGDKESDFEEVYLSLEAQIVDNLAFGLSYNYGTGKEVNDYANATLSYDIGTVNLATNYGVYKNTGKDLGFMVTKTKSIEDLEVSVGIGYSHFIHKTDHELDEKNLFMLANIAL